MNIKQNANRAAGLVRQLLAFSRRQTLRPTVIDLDEALSDISVLLARLLGETIELEVSARARRLAGQGRPEPARAGDREPRRQRARRDARRRQAHDPHRATSPRRKARKFKEQGFKPGDYVLLEVADTGTGMPRGGAGEDLRAVLHHQGRRAGAPGSASPPSTASSSRPAASSTSIRSRAPARPSASSCRATSAQPEDAEATAARRRSCRPVRPDRQRPHPAGRGRGGGARLRRARARGARLHRPPGGLRPGGARSDRPSSTSRSISSSPTW